jgi:hypothetical protein
MWALVVASLTLFAGLRGNSVGADTIAYLSRFQYLVISGATWDTLGSAEPGYKALLALARFASDDPTALLIITSFVASILYVSALCRLSLFPTVSVFVFIAFGFYAFHMNGLRQGLALGVYLHAIPALLLRRPVRYSLWVFVASLFHTTAVFTLPVYFLLRLGFSFKTVALLAFLSVLTAMSMDSILQFAGMANERYSRYGQRIEGGGAMLSLFHFLCAIFFIFSRSFVRAEWRYAYGQFLLLFLYGTALYLIVFLTGSYVEMTRMAIYFTASMAFIWPIILLSIDNARSQEISIIGLILVGGLFQYIYLQEIGNFIPYVTRV